MNITELKKDDLMIQVQMDFTKEDYADKKKKLLNKYRREVDIKGFRKGMAPMSLVEKTHGQSALVESINELISESLDNYVKENNLTILGEPLPNEEVESKNDWAAGENFTFVFDMALAPNYELSLSAEDVIPHYTITATAKSKEEYKSNILKQYGKLENCETVKEEDFIVADFEQGETRVEKTYVAMRTIKDEASKALFLGKKAGDSFELNVNEVFVNEADRAAMLKVKKEELASMDPMWKFTIVEVKNYVDAVPGQELYDMLFGKDTVKTEEEFDAKLAERMAAEYAEETDYRFILDAREYIINKANIALPEDFMKRWLFAANQGKFTMEQIEQVFPAYAKDFRSQTITQRIIKEQKLEIKKEDMLEQAKKLAKYQFASYGIPNVPEEYLVKHAESLIANENEGRRIFEKVEETKVLDYVRSVVTIEKKKISLDKFQKLQ